MKDKRRNFSSLQKDKLFLIYKGKCGICGNLLGDRWEADHILPWSLGGQTVIKNGQPACISCNRVKGISYMKLRKWQADFLQHYLSTLSRDYLMVATPEAGKTNAARKLKSFFDREQLDQLIEKLRE